jgi:hypothetical protein
MFSASKVGGSTRGITTFITGLAPPSYTLLKVQPGSSFFTVPERTARIKP